MNGSGHSQVMDMAREGRGKVDKSIVPPKGFGVVDYVFTKFQNRWKDEWRRRMVSQAGCEAIASEWRDSLRLFDDAAIHKAADNAMTRLMPPTLAAFVDAVELVVESRKPVTVNRALGRQRLNEIKSLFKDNGGVDGSNTGA